MVYRGNYYEKKKPRRMDIFHKVLKKKKTILTIQKEMVFLFRVFLCLFCFCFSCFIYCTFDPLFYCLVFSLILSGILKKKKKAKEKTKAFVVVFSLQLPTDKHIGFCYLFGVSSFVYLLQHSKNCKS